jgi:hypothetical protein
MASYVGCSPEQSGSPACGVDYRIPFGMNNHLVLVIRVLLSLTITHPTFRFGSLLQDEIS